MEVSGQLHILATLCPWKMTLLLTEKEGHWASQPIWMLWKGDTLPARARAKHDSPVTSPQSSHCLDYAG